MTRLSRGGQFRGGSRQPPPRPRAPAGLVRRCVSAQGLHVLEILSYTVGSGRGCGILAPRDRVLEGGFVKRPPAAMRIFAFFLTGVAIAAGVAVAAEPPVPQLERDLKELSRVAD